MFSLRWLPASKTSFPADLEHQAPSPSFKLFKMLYKSVGRRRSACCEGLVSSASARQVAPFPGSVSLSLMRNLVPWASFAQGLFCVLYFLACFPHWILLWENVASPAPPLRASQIHVLTALKTWTLGFPGGTSGKETSCQCRIPGFDPWVGKIPWRREWLCSAQYL